MKESLQKRLQKQKESKRREMHRQKNPFFTLFPAVDNVLPSFEFAD